MNLTSTDQYQQPRRHNFTRPEPVEWLEEYKWAGWRRPELTLPGRMRLPPLPKQPRDLIPPLSKPEQSKLPAPMKMGKEAENNILTFTWQATSAWPKNEQWKVKLKAILARLSVVGHRYPFQFEWSDSWFGLGSRWPGAIDVKMLCWDRANPHIEIWVSNPQAIPNDITPKTVTEVVRSAVKFLMQHEVDECLRVDNERRWDPHPPPFTGRIVWDEI